MLNPGQRLRSRRVERRDPAFERRVAETAQQWNEALLTIALPVTPLFSISVLLSFGDDLDRSWLVLPFVAAAIGLTGRALPRLHRCATERCRTVARRCLDVAVMLMGIMWGLLPLAVSGTRHDPELLLFSLLYPLGAAGVNVVLNSASRLRFHLFQLGVFGVVAVHLAVLGGSRNHLLLSSAISMCALNAALHAKAISMSYASIRAQLGNADLLMAADRDRLRIEAANARLAHQATHDDLTGLLNRRGVMARLEEAVDEAHRPSAVAVMVGDLDRFKVINDSLGHDAGDELLRIAAARLTAAAPEGTLIARLGGDELVVVVIDDDPDADDDAQRRRHAAMGETLRRAVAEPVMIGGHQIVVPLSLGLAMGADDHSGVDLVRHADAALHRAKASGRDRLEVFEERMSRSVSGRVEREQRLRRAIEDGEITPFYQPLVDAPTGTIIGAEVLARWVLPTGQIVPAGQFIELAEESGLVEPLSESILAHSLEDLVRWEADGLPDGFRISVNLPPRFVSATGRITRLVDLLAHAPLHRLCLEVTENAIVDDVGLAAARLDALRHDGAKVSLDDFGTGSASLTLLQRMPLDGVKLDRCFVTDIVSDPRDRVLVSGFVTLAHSLGLSTVAEGVETAEQAAALVEVGCTTHQGWLYAKAMPAAEFAAMIRRPIVIPALVAGA